MGEPTEKEIFRRSVRAGRIIAKTNSGTPRSRSSATRTSLRPCELRIRFDRRQLPACFGLDWVCENHAELA